MDKKKQWEYSQAIFCRNLNATKHSTEEPVFVATLNPPEGLWVLWILNKLFYQERDWTFSMSMLQVVVLRVLPNTPFNKWVTKYTGGWFLQNKRGAVTF